MDQINPVRTLEPYLFNAHFNIILSFTAESSEWFIYFRFLNQNFVRISHTSRVSLHTPCI